MKGTRAILGAIANGSTRLLSLFSLPTVAALVGVALSVAGLHMVYAPLAYIVPGAALVGGAVWLALPPATRRRE